MKLTSINVGSEQTLVRPNKTEQTGIFKRSVDGPVQVGEQGIPGDFIGDKHNHGGPDQAVYVYGSLDYDWWAAELGREMTPGLFGENLTIEGLESPTLKIGDRLAVGEVLLEVTAPRIPCGTLAGRMELPAFAKQFRFAGRPGVYCRVLRQGVLQAGDPVSLERYPAESVSIYETMRDYYENDLPETTLQRYMALPIAERLKEKMRERLAGKM